MADQTFIPGNGRIAADLFDFLKHVEGTAFKHTASQITTSPGVGGATDVQGSLDNVNTFIASLADQGKAFIAIPDGYNSYINPAPNFYFSNTIPALNTFLTPLFAAITAGGAMPTGYSRLKNGGILYLPAGTYYITDTVIVPPGIILLGEGYLTKIINATALDLSVSPPIVNGLATPKPVFAIGTDTSRSVNDDVIDSDDVNGSFMFGKSTKFMNFIIGDNFIEPTSLGDLNYKLPQNTSGNTPLILQNQGSNFELLNMYLVGRASTTGTAVDSATQFAIRLDTTQVPGSYLKVDNCFIDGFSIPIAFNASAGSADYLEVGNSKIKAYGYLGADATTPDNNCVFFTNDSNIRIINNSLFGNHSALLTILFINDVISGSVPVQGLSKVLVTANTFMVDRTNSTALITKPINYNSGIVSTALTKINPVAFGNAEGVGFEINTSLYVNTNSITSDYTVDSTVLDIVIFADTTTAPLTITLPTHRAGRKIIIKDVAGNASINHITLARNGGAGNIDDYAGDRTIANNWASLTLISNGTIWAIV